MFHKYSDLIITTFLQPDMIFYKLFFGLKLVFFSPFNSQHLV